jgi:Bacteriophage protein of unknown function (DUF646).
MAKQFVFFDSKEVMRAVDKGTRKALSKFGAFVRRRAKSSIRKRKRVSRPGEPPSSHTGKLKKNIFFGYDRTKKTVVIGATAFSSTRAQELLEYGGTRGKAIYRPRPYMRPAFSAELKNVNSIFKDFI